MRSGALVTPAGYPQRRPVYKVGAYTVHHGKLDPGDSRAYWIEGPNLDGRDVPLASFWHEGNARATADRMASGRTPF